CLSRRPPHRRVRSDTPSAWPAASDELPPPLPRLEMQLRQDHSCCAPLVNEKISFWSFFMLIAARLIQSPLCPRSDMTRRVDAPSTYEPWPRWRRHWLTYHCALSR